jgi:acetyl esterase/lipase
MAERSKSRGKAPRECAAHATLPGRQRWHLRQPRRSRVAGEALAAAGHDFDLALIPGHTHWFYEGGPDFAADAWAWFTELSADGV